MVKGRRCYCGRLYPGFRCAYCRLAEELSDEKSGTPALIIRHGVVDPNSSAEMKPTLWSRISAFGKSVLGGK